MRKGVYGQLAAKVEPVPMFLPAPMDFASGQDMLSEHPPCGIEPETDAEVAFYVWIFKIYVLKSKKFASFLS